MIEVSNKNAINIMTEMMPFKKFCQVYCGIYHEETKRIKGIFKETTGKVITGDDFEAHLVGKKTAEETYKAYLKWFNYTLSEYELPREFVSSEFIEVTK